MANQTLEHRGPEIAPEYYPSYAESPERVYPLYSWQVYIGAALMLCGMGALGLPITALAYQVENGDVNTTTTVIALVVFVLFELFGLAGVIDGFRRHKREPHAH